MVESTTLSLPDPGATERLGASLANAIRAVAPQSLVLFLDGELGAGKTALTRALLATLGHAGRVPSPTYTLVEPYRLANYRVLHVDLYRLRDPAELDDLGLADELGPGSLLVVEWPSRAAGRLPAPDLECQMGIVGAGRRARLVARSDAGLKVLRKLGQGLPAGI